MFRDRKSTLLSSGLLSAVMFLAASGNAGAKIASFSDSAQLAIKSPTQVMQPESKVKQSSPPTTTARLNRVKVFFPKKPQSNNNLSYVEAVTRTTRSQSLARFAVEQAIAGPTTQERQKGFAKAIQLRGSSNCSSDFKLSISQGIARLQFCRTVVSAGVGDDARVKSSLTATLKQFSGVKSVIILDNSGNCFGDMSGENRCLSNS